MLSKYPDKPTIKKQIFNNNPVTIVEHMGGLAGGYDVLLKNDDTLIVIEAGLAVYGSGTEHYGNGVLDEMLNTLKLSN